MRIQRRLKALVRRAASCKVKAVSDTELLEQAEQIDLDCSFGDSHLAGNLLVAHALPKIGNDLALARREAYAAAARRAVPCARKTDLQLARSHFAQRFDKLFRL